MFADNTVTTKYVSDMNAQIPLHSVCVCVCYNGHGWVTRSTHICKPTP